MKTGTWVVIIIAILVATGAFVFTKKAEAPLVTEEKLSAIELLKSATFPVPESTTEVTLVNGEAFFPIAPGSSQEGDILLLDKTSAEWEKGERKDLAAVFAVNTGGTGTFLYLVLFDVKGEVVTKKSEAFLGDRINVTHVGIGELVNDPKANYRVTVKTLVRKDTDPFAAPPTVEKTRTFYVTDQVLEEVEVGRDDS